MTEALPNPPALRTFQIFGKSAFSMLMWVGLMVRYRILGWEWQEMCGNSYQSSIFCVTKRIADQTCGNTPGSVSSNAWNALDVACAWWPSTRDGAHCRMADSVSNQAARMCVDLYLWNIQYLPLSTIAAFRSAASASCSADILVRYWVYPFRLDVTMRVNLASHSSGVSVRLNGKVINALTDLRGE